MSNNADEFWNFLGSWFPDADLEGTSDDQQVVRNFLDTKNARKIEQVCCGCDEILAMSKLPMDRIMNEANRHFDTEEECLQWLLMCRSILSESPSI
jgi:hypothetical protein